MPLLTRVFLKCGFAWLAVGLIAGVAASVPGARAVSPAIDQLHHIYIHALVVGWIGQLIFGVAFWMFPSASHRRPQGSLPLAWSVVYMLNAGLIMRSVAEPMLALGAEPWWSWMLVASAVPQFMAGTAFVLYIWSRIRGK